MHTGCYAVANAFLLTASHATDRSTREPNFIREMLFVKGNVPGVDFSI